MTSQPNTESRMKVWRPYGFEGLELEQFENIQDIIIPHYLMQGYEIITGFEGSAKVEYACELYNFDNVENLFLAQHPGEIGHLDARDEKPLSVWTLRLYPDLLQTLQDDLNVPPSPAYFPSMTAPDAHNDRLAALTKETIQSFAEPVSSLERESRLLLLMGEVLTHMAEFGPPERRLGKEHRAVTLVREALDAHPEMDTTLTDLADLTNLNKHYLYRVFKYDMGVSPHTYQTVRRVYRAKDLLHQGMTPAQTALETGFHDQSHLTRVFKKYTQVTPGRFQRDSLDDGLMTELGT